MAGWTLSKGFRGALRTARFVAAACAAVVAGCSAGESDDGGTQEPPPGSGGSMTMMEAAAPPDPNVFETNLGFAPTTPIDQLPESAIVQACAFSDDFLERHIPDADAVRAACVFDAVINRGAATVADCESVSSACIAMAPPPPGTVCTEPQADFVCPATLENFEQCITDLAAQRKRLVELLVCSSLEDPDIQMKLDQAAVNPPSCTSFAQNCPTLFPPPPVMPAP